MGSDDDTMVVMVMMMMVMVMVVHRDEVGIRVRNMPNQIQCSRIENRAVMTPTSNDTPPVAIGLGPKPTNAHSDAFQYHIMQF